ANYVQRFGFREDQIPRDLSLALGSGSATPLEMARAYSVWANGGFYVTPYYIKEIRDSEGEVVFSANPAVACLDCDEATPEQEPVAAEAAGNDTAAATVAGADATVPSGEAAPADAVKVNYAKRVVDYDNVYLMTSLMQDVIKRGTGRRALALGRSDLAGKTGTTNDQRDAWFCGFDTQLVTTVWVGFDQVQPLGNGETGSRAALPMWIDYMHAALKDVPPSTLAQPPDLVTVRIDAKTGLRLPPGEAGGLFELFRPGHVPKRFSQPSQEGSEETAGHDTAEPLF
ncbi:MAG: penicillin-binding transpeptidase domain-containing protein, partial [Thiogranum sp.]